MERASALRPGGAVSEETLQAWLRELDSTVRAQLFGPGSGAGFPSAGADLAWDGGLDDGAELLIPAPFDRLYPHYLCAMIDGALGEIDRYSGEMTQYNTILAEFSLWLRRARTPRPVRVKW